MKRHQLILILIILFATSCSSDESDNKVDIEAGTFDDFKYPEKYAAIVESAEAGNKKNTILLARYFSNVPKTDLRNLDYWSRKASKFNGRDEMTNLIVSLTLHEKCQQAWKVLELYYDKPSEFAFYGLTSRHEKINDRCSRDI